MRVFYDQFEIVNLWGVDLPEHLDDVYRRKARYAMVFASENYARKMWTNHERRSLQTRALEEKDAYLLPVRLDDTDIPGLRPTTGYLDARQHSPEDVARAVLVKLSMPAQPRKATTEREPVPVPMSIRARQRLLAERPSGWEYMLLADRLWNAVQEREPRFLDFELGYARSNGAYVEREDFLHFGIQRLAAAGELISKAPELLNHRNQQ
ncbi:hypothetical protein GCM10009539_70610 [Cryptosporangium japonicum]|uniref:TIR domain-containing protein n=1 Tax=Cryptosporangium japonicum TaxID=80872 RepID=A0ABP3EPT1_9ACTN